LYAEAWQGKEKTVNIFTDQGWGFFNDKFLKNWLNKYPGDFTGGGLLESSEHSKSSELSKS
jgi:hypothetical protein